jgi:hypothetical protein
VMAKNNSNVQLFGQMLITLTCLHMVSRRVEICLN